MRKGNSEPLAEQLAAELHALERMPDSDIDTSDMAEARDWSGGVRGRFHDPSASSRGVPIEADVLAYFQAQGPGYLARINRVLRASMLRGLRKQRLRS